MKRYYKVIVPIILVSVVALVFSVIYHNYLGKKDNVDGDKLSDEGIILGDQVNGNETFEHRSDYLSLNDRVALLETLVVEDAGNHNSIYRGKNVTSYLTASGDNNLYTRISSGKFTDLYVGDYFTKDITIGGNTTTVTWRIAGFDMYYNKGDSCENGTACKVHHAVIVPDTNLMQAPMSDNDSTYGGYEDNNTKMYVTTLPTIETAIKNAFGSSHILKYRALLSSRINTSATNRFPGTTGASDAWQWCYAYVNLMNMIQVTGNIGFSGSGFDTGAENIQFPLFRLKPEFINKAKSSYWVRDIISSTDFAYIDLGGASNGGRASTSLGVRPYFYID